MYINSSDTAFIIISTALVFMMTPALAFFYGGMVRRKNVLNTILSSFFICGLASVLWVVIGYSLSFGEDIHGFIGGFNHIFFKGVSMNPSDIYATTIPETLFAAFQMMFSIITPALIIGALVSPICFFCMSTLKSKFGYDDALDAFGCHGVGGIWGGIATGIFADSSINFIVGGIKIKKIEAIIRPSKLEELKDELRKFDTSGLTISQVLGCGKQMGWTEQYRSNEVLINVLPNVKIEMVVDDKNLDKVINLIINIARTGEVGDGKIFVSDISDCIRIRTGERVNSVL